MTGLTATFIALVAVVCVATLVVTWLRNRRRGGVLIASHPTSTEASTLTSEGSKR